MGIGKAQSGYYIDSPVQLVCLAAVAMVGNLSAFTLPIILGALVDHAGVSLAQAGFMGTAEMAGLGLGAIVFSRLILSTNWRAITTCGLAVVATANLATLFVDNVWLIGATRFAAGLGGGMLLALGNTGLSCTRSPEKIIGMSSIAAMLFASAALYSLPLLGKAYGSFGIFFSMAALFLVLLVAIPKIPLRAPYVEAQQSATSSVGSKSDEGNLGEPENPTLLFAVLLLLGIFLFFVGAMSFWAFFERAGVAASFSPEQISARLGSSQLFGAVGALTAIIMSTRLGNRIVPTATAIALASGAAIVMTSTPSLQTYTIAASAFLFSWALLYPYLMGASITLDRTGRLTSYSLALQTIGKSIGPAIAAQLVIGSDFTSVYWFCLVLFAGALFALIPAIRRADLDLRKPAEEAAPIVDGEPTAVAELATGPNSGERL